MLIEPVEIESTGAMAPFWPSRMIEPLPNCFSIWPTAMSMALLRSFRSSSAMRSPSKSSPSAQGGCVVGPVDSGREIVWPERVTGKVTAGLDPRNVPRESQAKIRADQRASTQGDQSLTAKLDFRLAAVDWQRLHPDTSA